MATKRMFANAVIDQDEFVMLTAEAQLLYFHLGLKADDDGFVPTQKILKILSFDKSPLDELERAGFIIRFDGEAIVAITHWNLNNELKKDRYHATPYQSLRNQLGLNVDRMYYKLEPERNQNGTGTDTQYSTAQQKQGISGKEDKESITHHRGGKGSPEGETDAFQKLCSCAETQGILLNNCVKAILQESLDNYPVDSICSMIINDRQFRLKLQTAAVLQGTKRQEE